MTLMTRRSLMGGLLSGVLALPTAAAPFTRTEVRASGLIFPVLLWGEDPAPPVMLLHGFPQDPFTWRPVAERLAVAGYQVIVPFLRGYAPGNRFAPYTYSQFASDCLEIADVLGVGQFDVAGAGTGAALAWILAGYHPERVRSVASVLFPHPAALAYACGQDPRSKQQWLTAQQRLGAADPRRHATELLAADAAGLKLLLSAAHLPEFFVRRYLQRMRDPEALAAALSWYSAVTLEEFAWVPMVEMPALLLWGKGAHLPRLAANATKGCVGGWLMEVEVPSDAESVLESSPSSVTHPLLTWLRTLAAPRGTAV